MQRRLFRDRQLKPTHTSNEKAETLEEARQMLEKVIEDGSALQIFKDFIEWQGGNPAVVDNPKLLPQAAHKIDILAPISGTVSYMEADEIGTAAMLLGAGRATKESEIDLAVGIMLHKKVGDTVKEGEALATFYANSEDIQDAKEKFLTNITISEQATDAPPLVYKIITG